MLQMERIKKIKIELLDPVGLRACFEEENDSIYSNIIRGQVHLGAEANANTVVIEQSVFSKSLNPRGLIKDFVKGLVDVVKINIADRGLYHKIKTLQVEGHTYCGEDPNKVKVIDLFGDSFKVSFKIPEIQIHSDVQQYDRQIGIESLYNDILPEIRQIIGR